MDTRTAELVDVLGREVERVTALPAVRRDWEAPSALAGMTVGALAAHAARAISTTLAYLDGPVPAAAAPVTSPAGYVLAVLGDASLEDDVHVGIRDRAAAGAAAGPDAVLDRLASERRALAARLAGEPPDRHLAVRDGVVLTLEDYLATRLVELVVHLDDLAASVPGVEVEVPDAAAAVVVAVLADLARLRHGWAPVIRSLARRERAAVPVHAL